MTRLLASVRDEAEAQIAVRPGAEVIDVKQPDRGPLITKDELEIRPTWADAPSLSGRGLG